MISVIPELLPEVFNPEQARDDIVMIASELITLAQEKPGQPMGRLRTQMLDTGNGAIFSYGDGLSEPSRSVILSTKGPAIEMHDYHTFPHPDYEYVMQKRLSVVSRTGDHHIPGQTVYKKDAKSAEQAAELPLAAFTLLEAHALIKAIAAEKDMPVPEQPKPVTLRDRIDTIGRIVLSK
jgi:hypothetical protein